MFGALWNIGLGWSLRDLGSLFRVTQRLQDHVLYCAFEASLFRVNKPSCWNSRPVSALRFCSRTDFTTNKTNAGQCKGTKTALVN